MEDLNALIQAWKKKKPAGSMPKELKDIRRDALTKVLKRGKK